MADDLADALARVHAQRNAATARAAGITPVTAANITRIADLYPNLGAAVVPLGVANAPDRVIQKAAAAKTRQQSRTVKPGKEVSGSWMSNAWGAIKDKALKPVVRYGMAGASMPWEYIQGGFRTNVARIQGEAAGPNLSDMGTLLGTKPFTDIAANRNAEFKQTTVGAGITEAREQGKLLSPTDWDTISGDGWFIGPDSKAGRRQVREARTAALIDGRAATPGRAVASLTPLDAGSTGYNVLSGFIDLAATLGLDPMTYVGGGVAKASRGRRVISEGPVREYELANDRAAVQVLSDGRFEAGLIDGARKTVLPEKAIAWLDSDKAGKTINAIAAEKDFERLRRATGKKLPVSLLVDLVDADDPVTVKNLVAEAISKGAVREKMTYRVKRDDPARILGMMPGNKIDLDDIDDAVEQLDRFQRNVRLSPEQISRNNLALARAGSKGERFDVVKSVLNTVRQGLETAGVPAHRARTLTQAFDDAYRDNRRYFVDAVGDNAHVPGAVIGGTGKALPSPHLSTELIERYVPLPNARDLKAATRDHAVVSKVQGTLGYRAVRDFSDFVTNDLFKTFALALRPAWTVRVVGEEQFRMGAAGLSSAFHHPLSYIAWVAGEKPGKLQKIMRGGRGGTDALGESFTDDVAEGVTDFQQALNRGSAGWRNRVNVAARHWTTYRPDEAPYVDGWHDELVQLMSDPVAREVARNGVEHTKRLFWNGNLQGIRKELQAANPRMRLDDLSEASRYVDSVLDRIRVKTAGHPDLIQAIGTGKVGSHALMLGVQPNPAAKRALEALRDAGIGPKVVKGRVTVSASDDSLSAMARNYDQAAEFLFNALGSVPANKLSRSPVFRQRYWQRVEELAPMLSKNDRARLARQAKEAGLDKGTVARLRALVDGPGGDLSLEDADRVAKAFGLGETRRLLYSLHERAQWADALRVVFPFGEAWWEVLTRWARLGTENPLVPYRAAQGLSEGEGVFFAPDPMTGEEMINIPGSEWVTDKLTGVPMRLDMPLKGLNMFGQVLPGVGPVVSVPAGLLIPEDPGADWLRDMVLPYGETDVSSGALESFFPAYLKKLAASVGWESPAQQRQIASTTRDVMAYLYSTGEYDLSSPEGQDRLIEDAKGKAVWLYRIRALAQSSAPSAPTSKFAALDKDGRLHAMFKLAADYRRMQTRDYRTATERFLNKYGEGAFLAVIPKTTGGGAPTDAVNRLARSHPDVARKFPAVFSYFAPGGEIDPAEIERQIQAGTRELVGPEKAAATANIRLANAVYAEAVKRAGESVDEDERAWLREVKDRLKADFPGYTGGFDSTKGEGTVQELIRAASDPVLKETRAGEALNIYLQARERAIQGARRQGFAGPWDAKDARPWRDWLRGVAAKLVADYPEFGDMYEYVLEREMTEDE